MLLLKMLYMLNFIHNYKTDLVNPSHQKEKGYARQNSTSHILIPLQSTCQAVLLRGDPRVSPGRPEIQPPPILPLLAACRATNDGDPGQ